ncbi:putative nuclease HARBI1 [Gigantopelta aegis]|uniref:putative nuclease HARBI1 n=1 Tax=Gigantopelta aegis TaxID=1735272 RepID=UPI001B88A1D0|nr:putative nuclease HARBI1 [Gigantopelta aegis]
MDDGRVYRPRVNPFADFTDDDFIRKYRFTKPILTEPIFTCAGPREIHTQPAADEIALAKRQFYDRFGFPCIISLIDGSQVPIHGPFPPANEAVYVCRKGYHAINVQIVCDANLIIRDLDARWPGSTHDSFILRNSHIWDKFEQGHIQNTWLLGDSGYPLKKWLMTPYQNAANDPQERFNRQHKHIRSIIECCNGVWKMRWRCLMKPNMFQSPRASMIIASYGALHNFAITHGLPLDEDVDERLIKDQRNIIPYHDPGNNVMNDVPVHERNLSVEYSRTEYDC